MLDFNLQRSIADMVDTATQDGVDVLRNGIPTDIFISAWEDEYGEDFPEFVRDEIEREFKDGLPVNTAAIYYQNLHYMWVERMEEEGITL